MPRYGSRDYSFVIDSNFRPFSFQELIQPLALYKDAYEQTEAAYDDLTQKADTFSYLAKVAEDNPDSQAAQIYKGYADELHKQAEDLAKHGLNMGNRRALTNLKRRYRGEIGLLDAAKTAMDKEKELRRAMATKDPSILYAENNLNIDQFLGDSTPNLYSVSGTDLYNRGAIVGKNYSSRIYSTEDGGRTLGGYYRDYIQRMGYTPDQLARFSNEIMEDFTRKVSVLPELQQAAQSILDTYGVPGNLSGDNLHRAQQQVIRGIVDNAVYNEDHKPVRDEGVMSASEAAANTRANRSQMASEAMQGITWVNGKPVYNKDNDISLQRQLAIAKEKASNSTSSTGSSKKGGTDRVTQLKGRLKLTWDSGNPEVNADDAKKYTPTSIANDEAKHSGPLVDYDSLPLNIQKEVDKVIGDGNEGMYNYYYKPHDSSAWWGGQPEIEIEPRDIKIVDQATEDLELLKALFGNSGE